MGQKGFLRKGLRVSTESLIFVMRRFLGERTYSLENYMRGKISLGLLSDGSLIFFRIGGFDNWIIEEIYNLEIYERCFKPSKGDVVADVGAHIGAFTLKTAKEVGKKGLVLAFEPESSNLGLLRFNVSANNLKNVKVFPLGIGANEGWAKLHVNDEDTSRNSINFEVGKRTCTVRLSTLDKIIERNSSGVLDFLKIDVEGYELSVLKGAAMSLAGNSTKVAIAAYHYENEVEVITHYLRKLSYETEIRFNPLNNTPFIFAAKR